MKESLTIISCIIYNFIYYKYIMTRETLTTKRKLEILKEFWEHRERMAKYFPPERIEAAILLWLYDTLMKEEWIENRTKDDLVEAFEEMFTEDYVETLREKYCETKQDYLLLRQWIGFCWGLFREDEDIYQIIEDVKVSMALLKKKSNLDDLPELFEIVYWTLEEEKEIWDMEKIKRDIKKLRG